MRGFFFISFWWYLFLFLQEYAVPKVRLSGRISGANDATRASRADLFHILFENGWDIYNSNGDQDIRLDNVQEKIREADAFVFTPEPDLADLFKACSIMVGYQTKDPELMGKPTVFLSPNDTWEPLLQMLEHLHEMGTIRQTIRNYLVPVDTVEEVLDQISGNWKQPDHIVHVDAPGANSPKSLDADVARPDDIRYSVCVFCSASIKDEDALQDGYLLGLELAKEKLGCISGAGRTGIMGEVVRGNVEGGGWSAGSNVPHIIELEGLPDGLSMFWPRPDIYTRMEIMIEESQAFVILPGGSGTLQELLALLLRRERKDPSMDGKPIVIYDKKMSDGNRFWSPLFEIIGDPSENDGIEVALEREEILSLIHKGRTDLQSSAA